MIWFNGTITSAVDKVKASSSLLLVFVQGEDDLSKKYERFLNDDTKINPEDVIALKILYNSVALDQFKKIYVTVPVPSVFLIGADGVPLSIFCSEDLFKLWSIIREAVDKQSNQKCMQVQNHMTEDSKIPLPVAEKETCPELNSKDIGSYFYKFFVQERKMRFEKAQICPPLFFHETHSFCCKICMYQKVQSARIQFRLPSNEVRSWEFPNMCTLHDVRLYLMETMKLKSGFKLLKTYPRTAFTIQDEDKTLTELALTPNATLIVVPVQQESIQSRIKNALMKGNLFVMFIATIFQPIFNVISNLRNYLSRTSDKKNSESSSTSKKNQSGPMKKRFSKKTSTSNIHGFAFEESDSDSDMNTDNGNSTQQK